MSKPLSPDLRKRLVCAVLDEGMSRNRAAARFNVGISRRINSQFITITSQQLKSSFSVNERTIAVYGYLLTVMNNDEYGIC